MPQEGGVACDVRYIVPDFGAGGVHSIKARLRRSCQRRSRDGIIPLSATVCALLCVLRGAICSLEFLHIIRRELWLIERDGQLVDLTGERKRDLVIAIIHRRASVCPDVEGLILLQDKRHRPIHGLRRDHLAIDFQCACAASAEAQARGWRPGCPSASQTRPLHS